MKGLEMQVRLLRVSAASMATSVFVIAAIVWVSFDAFAVRADNGRQNPDLVTTCGTDVIVVLDESASIASPVDFTPEVRAAILNFADGMIGTGSRMRLVEFSTNGRDVALPGGTGFQLVDEALRAQVADYLNGSGLPQDPTSFHPSTEPGSQIYTNWEAGLFEAASPGSPVTGGIGAPLVVFITDGDPNTDGTTGDSAGANLGNNEAGYQSGADAAIEEISNLQRAGAHVLSIAVGGASQQQAAYDRLSNLTEPGTFEQWTGTGTFRVATTDVLRVTFFDGLRNALTGVLNSLCGASLTIKKTDPAGNVISGRPLSLTVNSASAGQGLQWVAPSTTPTTVTTPSSRTANTASSGLAQFSWIPGSNANPQTWTSLVTMSETLPAGWSAGDASCTIAGRAGGPIILRPTVVGQLATWGGSGLAVGSSDVVACTVVNKRPTQVTIKKVATPADGTDFNFAATSTGSTEPLPTSFSLDVDGNATLPSSQTFTVSPGAYTVTETAPGEPWRLAKLSCKMAAQTPSSSAKTNLVARTATLVLSEGDQVTCTYTNIATVREIAVAKTASPASFEETSGTVTYGVAISNKGTEQLTITQIRDAVKLRGAAGPAVDLDLSLDSPGAVLGVDGTVTANTCDDVIARPTVLDPGQSVNCAVTMTFTDRNAGQVIDDTISVVAVDAANTAVNAQSSAEVSVLGKQQVMIVDKQNVQTWILAPGGMADYNLVITNGPNATEPITIATISDQMYVDRVGLPVNFLPFGAALNVTSVGGAVTATTCGALIDQVLAPGASASCAMTIDTTALDAIAAGDTLRNEIVVASTDDEGAVITGRDIADRPVLLTARLLDVWKTDGRATVVEPSSQVTYSVWIDNRGVAGVNPWLRIDKIVDDIHFRRSNTDPIGETIGNVTIDASGVTSSFTLDGASLVDTTCAPLIGRLLQPSTGLSPYPGFGQDAPRLRPTNADARAECTITLQLPADAGNQFDDTVSVDTTDPGESLVRGSNGANTPVIGAAPQLALVKTANPTAVSEPGGDVTFTFLVTNTSVTSDPVTIIRLSDDIFGDLLDPTRTDTNCRAVLANVVLAPGASLTCTLTQRVSGTIGQDHVNIAVVTGVDNDGVTVTATDDARVTIVDLLPTIEVIKTAIAPEPLPVTLPELGANVTFQVDVVNTSPEVVTLVSLVDSVFGNLDGQGTCAIGETIEVAATYSCTFTAFVRQLGSEAAHINVVTAHAIDDENNDATDADNETITFERTPPAVVLSKTDNGATTVEPGGAVAYTITFGNPATATEDLVQVTSLTDTVRYRDRAEPVVLDLLGPPSTGVIDNNCPAAIAAAIPIVAGEDVSCTFTVVLSGTAQIVSDVVTITAIDNDSEQATAIGDETTPIIDFPPAVTIVKSADPIVFPDGEATTYTFTITNGTAAEPFYVVKLVDDRFGDLTQSCWPTTLPVLAPLGQPGDSVVCSQRLTPNFAGSGTHRNIATVSGGDDELLDLIRNPGEGTPPALVTASDDEIVTVGVTPLIAVKLDSVCVRDAPYITYEITSANFTPVTTPTLTFYDRDGKLVLTMPVDNFAGRVLYPGAAVNAAGEGADWPGWKFENDSWVTDSTDARWREGLRVVVSVNPTAEGTVSYPPPTASCAGPKTPTKRPGNVPLPATGPGGIVIAIRTAAILSAGGVALALLHRRRRSTTLPS